MFDTSSMVDTHLNYFSAVEELKRFMEVAKLQNPTRRTKEKAEPKVYSETVKHEEDGSVTYLGQAQKPGPSIQWIVHQLSRDFQSEYQYS